MKNIKKSPVKIFFSIIISIVIVTWVLFSWGQNIKSWICNLQNVFCLEEIFEKIDPELEKISSGVTILQNEENLLDF